MTQEPALAAPGADARSGRGWVTGRRSRVLYCVSSVSFMIMLDSNIVAVSLPSIARDLHAAFADIEWVVSAYVLTFAALLMPAGALSDRYGRRRVLCCGLTIFTLASLVCGLASTPALLNAARAVQGIGAALQLSAALAVLGHEFRGAERARAFAFWGTVIGLAVAAGPPIGGVITSAFGWRWAFLVNIPIGVALLYVAASAVEESRDPQASRLDLAGMALFGSGLFCLVWAMIGANTEGWSSTDTVTKLCVGAGLLVLFIVAESVQKRPMVDFDLFRKRTFLGSGFAMMGFAGSAQVMMTFLPLYLQNGFGLSPIFAGLGMLPFALPLFICPRLGATLATRISGRSLLAGGLLLVAIGNLVMALMLRADGPYPAVAFGMLVTGCGAGLLNGETAKVQMSVVPPERGGMASGIAATIRFVGLVVGLTGLGAVLASATRGHFAAASAGAHAAFDGSAAIVSRIIAGDMAGVISEAAPTAREALHALGRQSFSAGFSVILLVAAAVAAIAALLTYVLVSPIETAPTRFQPAEPALPELLD